MFVTNFEFGPYALSGHDTLELIALLARARRVKRSADYRSYVFDEPRDAMASCELANVGEGPAAAEPDHPVPLQEAPRSVETIEPATPVDAAPAADV